jgi:integrase family protein with SAM-like domain
MAGPQRQRRLAGPLDTGPLGADIASFRLHLAAEGKSARTVESYTGAVRWFAAAHLLGPAGKTSWEQADVQDIQQWMVQLLDRYSSAYASIQFRALRQLFKWRAAEDDSPDPMTRLRAPKVAVRQVPVFTSVELSELQKACQGRSFAARRDTAIIAVSPRPASGSQSWPGSGGTTAIPPAATWTYTPGRSRSAARAGHPVPSRSATRLPAAWTATCGPAPGTRSPGGRSCGSA